MKTAQIKSTMWKDTWFQDLDSNQKLIWIYLLSCEQANVAGIYDMSIKTISNETEISKENVKATLDLFEKMNKAFFRDKFIILANRVKYNADNDGISRGIINILKELPEDILTFASSTDTKIGDLIKEIGGMVPKTGDTSILSYLNSIQVKSKYQSNQSNSKPAKNDRQGWTDGFSLIFDQIKDDYGLSNSNLQKLYAIADSEPGRQMINEIWKKIELKGDIEKKGNYLMSAIRKNSMKSEL